MLEDFTFVVGVGNYNTKECCLLTAATALEAGYIPERLHYPLSVCPVIQSLGAYINDHCFENGTDRKAWALPRASKILRTADREARNIQLFANRLHRVSRSEFRREVREEGTFCACNMYVDEVYGPLTLFEELIRA